MVFTERPECSAVITIGSATNAGLLEIHVSKGGEAAAAEDAAPRAERKPEKRPS